jgi:peptidoglycan/xylan/chitin deacetylase (PgdA/CDA1 family)
MRAILTYHSIDDSGSPISVSPGVFQAQVQWLAEGPVRVLSLEDLISASPEDDAVALTFDDGFVNFGTVAAPLLEENGLPATLFVVANYVGKDNQWNGKKGPGIPVLPLLDWAALGRCAESGVDIGGHTLNHPNLCQLSVERIRQELADAATTIAREIGTSPHAVAYPYGAHTPEISSMAEESYRLGVTTELRSIDIEDDPLCLPRLDMYYYRSRGQLESWGSRRFDQRLWIRRQARKIRQTLAAPRGAL